MNKLWMVVLIFLAGCNGTNSDSIQQATSQCASPSHDTRATCSAPDPADAEILIIGDSISMDPGYTPYVQQSLPCVAHAPGNNGSSTNVVENMQAWIGDHHYRIIHFNAGLWDIAHRTSQSTSSADLVSVNLAPISTTEDEYKANLERIIPFLMAHADVVIWASTTDVPAGSVGRDPSDVPRYNRIAHDLVHYVYGLPEDDLYSLMLPHADLHIDQDGNKAHYSDEGYQILARHVIETLNAYGGC